MQCIHHGLLLMLPVLLLAPVLVRAQLPDIKIGMTGPLTSESGSKMSAGLRLAFQQANYAGGIMSRNITLVAMNDNYNTTSAIANIRTLLDTENVLLLAGVVGSDTVELARPLVLSSGVPYVGPFTGIEELHTPFRREYINIRVGVADEMVAQALFLVRYAQVQRIACMYQSDSFGIGGLTALSSALANVGMQVMVAGSYSRTTVDVTGAVGAIASASPKVQAVVLVGTSPAIIKFINQFHADKRADPACIFTVVSSGYGSPIIAQVSRSLWSQLYFFLVVPVPGDSSSALAANFESAYTATGNVSEPISMEGYITGRFIVEVLKQTHSANVTRESFLDQVYSTRMFVLDDLLVGMYSTNYSGCSQALCSCNSGLRSVYLAQLNPATGTFEKSQGTFRYSVVECRNPTTNVIAPLLFGQLVPNWDAGWHAVALEIGRGISEAFAEANAAGGAGNRDFLLLQQNYSSDATQAMINMTDRYPLASLLGSVVPSTADINTSISSIGNFGIEADAVDDAFSRNEVHLQPATSLELMAMAQWAVQEGCSIHLRVSVTNNNPALLQEMIKSVNSFQGRPASAALFSESSDVLSSTKTGCVIAIGSDADVLSWYDAMPSYPNLHLLTLSGPVMRLMALYPNASNLCQAPRLHFSTIITSKWNTTIPSSEPSEAWKYGYVLGTAVVQALLHSEFASKSYTTSAQLLSAWYSVKLMSAGSITFGPYYDNTCSKGSTECECSEGVRSVAVRSAACTDVEMLYSMSTCHVVYVPLVEGSSDVTTGAVVGAVVGFFACVVVGVVLYLHCTKRNHSAAPKDASKAFCVLFTDIQASTHLWATIPDIMAPALDAHHALIRKLIAKHNCYEVKTIGDSFMCAAHKPQQAIELALAIQESFHEHEWADAGAINAVYAEGVPEAQVERISCTCWNGLRVRVGIHFGFGEIKLDPVSNSYDYYGTVVNVAARIESLCHGGQIGMSEVVYDMVQRNFSEVVWSDLGCPPLRGLSEPIHLYQALPAGPLAGRKFPPLRIDHAEHKQKAMVDFNDMDEEIDIVTDVPSSKSNSVHPHPSTDRVTAETLGWVETHPMVMRGDITAEDLKVHYMVALSTVSTLLTTQTTKFKEAVVHGLCERLHVANYGVEGPLLQRTLRGLVHRVLPATVKNAHRVMGTRHNSHGTLIGRSSDGTLVGSFKTMRDSPLAPPALSEEPAY